MLAAKSRSFPCSGREERRAGRYDGRVANLGHPPHDCVVFCQDIGVLCGVNTHPASKQQAETRFSDMGRTQLYVRREKEQYNGICPLPIAAHISVQLVIWQVRIQSSGSREVTLMIWLSVEPVRTYCRRVLAPHSCITYNTWSLLHDWLDVKLTRVFSQGVRALIIVY